VKKLDTPNWLKNAIGMRYYDIEIKDAYIAINTNRPQGFDLPVVFLELDSKIFLDILPALKREDSHGTVPLGWDIVVYDVTCS